MSVHKESVDVGPAIKCLDCGSVIQSTGQKHYEVCYCGAIGVDGGKNCTRIVGFPHKWEVVTNEPFEKKREKEKQKVLPIERVDNVKETRLQNCDSMELEDALKEVEFLEIFISAHSPPLFISLRSTEEVITTLKHTQAFGDKDWEYDLTSRTLTIDRREFS